MKNCIKCGKEIADDSTVCEHCQASQEDPTKVPKYTDEDVNRMIAKDKRETKEENKLLRDKLDEMAKTLASVKEKNDDLYGIIVDDTAEEEFFEDEDIGEEDEDLEDEDKSKTIPKKKKDIKDAVEAARNTMKLRYEKRLTDYEKRVIDLEKQTEEAKQEVFETKKSDILNQALVSANVKPHLMEESAELLRKHVVYDEIDRKWLFRKFDSGADIDLRDGIINTLKEEFFVSYTPGAGSGGKGAVSKEVDRLNTLRKNFEKAKEEAGINPNNDMSQLEYMKARKLLQDAEKAAKASGAIK
ncbi:hypothetical protein M0R19_04870 [Candidatus Pacearchaeota archaeon]|nr:hypothetical protein [Candidatus Pacearchaeota archaeon]